MKKGRALKSFLATFLTVPILTLAATAAYAQTVPDPWYVGISAGQSSVNFSNDFLKYPGATGDSLSKDEKGDAYKFFAGYRFMRHFALEGGYTDFGKFSAARTIGAIALFGPGSIGATVKASGFHVDAVGILPVRNFELFGKIGAMRTTMKTTFTGSGSVLISAPGVPNNATSSEWNLKGGIGAGYQFSNSFGLRLEYERAFKVGNPNTTGEGDISMWSIGGVYRF